MQWNEIATVITLVASVVALILAYRQLYWANPKRRISLHIRGLELGYSPKGNRMKSLDVVEPSSLGQQAAGGYRIMNDRTLVVITLEATGRADVSQDRFSREVPFVVECGSKIYKVLVDDEAKKRNNIRLRDDLQAVLLGPMLLKKGRPIEIPLRIENPVRDNFGYDDMGLRDVDVAFSIGEGPRPTVSAELKQTPLMGVLLAGCATGVAIGWIMVLSGG